MENNTTQTPSTLLALMMISEDTSSFECSTPRPPSRVSIRLGRNGNTAPFQPRLSSITPIGRDRMMFYNIPEIVFVVGGKKIPVHKHVLLRASTVFQAMIEGPMAEGSVIEVNDSLPEDFEIVVQALYEGLRVISVLTSISQILRCFEIAHKYNIRSLEVGILTDVLKRLSYLNVMEVLSAPIVDLGIVADVTSKCWSIIEKNTLKVIKTPGFLMISWLTLNKLLQNPRLTVPEAHLAKAVVEWCKNQRGIHRRYRNSTLVEILGVAVYQIRFPLMTSGDFELICKLGILQQGEIKDLKVNFRNNKTFKTVKRINKCGCCTRKIYCPLCSLKWTQGRQRAAEWKSMANLNASITTDWNNNANKNQVEATNVIPTPEPCDCIKYLSCPNFANGLTVKIMRLQQIGGFR